MRFLSNAAYVLNGFMSLVRHTKVVCLEAHPDVSILRADVRTCRMCILVLVHQSNCCWPLNGAVSSYLRERKRWAQPLYGAPWSSAC
jgi:hypothetical protein